MSTARLAKSSNETIFVFDGDCAFCTTWTNRLKQTLPFFPRSSPWQWLDLDAYGLTASDVQKYAWVVTPHHQYAGHLAFSALLRMQRQPGWRFAGHLLATPPFSWAGALGYSLVARYRHVLPGGTPACALPPDQR